MVILKENCELANNTKIHCRENVHGISIVAMLENYNKVHILMYNISSLTVIRSKPVYNSQIKHYYLLIKRQHKYYLQAR